MSRKELFKKWLWCFSLLAAAILLYKMYDNAAGAVQIINKFFGLLAPILGGFALAFLLYGPSNWLEVRFLGLKNPKWQKLARPVAMAITYVGFLGLLALLLYLIIPILISSLSDLADTLPERLTEAQENMQKWTSGDGALSGLGLEGAVPNIFGAISTATGTLFSTENVITALKGVGNIASSLINVVVALVLSVYMLHGREELLHAVRNFAGLFFRRRTLANLRHYTRRTGRIFSKYIYGALLDALLVGVAASIGLLIFRVPYAILLGMLLGMMNLVPYFGTILGGVMVSLLTLLTNGLPVALGVAAYILVIQQIDANIVQPRIIADSMGLRPIYVLLGITFFGGLFGFWGILLGPPLMGVIQMIVRDIYARRKKQAARKKGEDLSPTIEEVPVAPASIAPNEPAVPQKKAAASSKTLLFGIIGIVVLLVVVIVLYLTLPHNQKQEKKAANQQVEEQLSISSSSDASAHQSHTRPTTSATSTAPTTSTTPTESTQPTLPTATTGLENTNPTATKRQYIPYIVRSGDTLALICKAHKLNYDLVKDELLAKNGIDNPNHIVVGQTIFLPYIPEP